MTLAALILRNRFNGFSVSVNADAEDLRNQRNLWIALIDPAALDIISLMSKTEILEELPKLTKTERDEIRLKLAEIDGESWFDGDEPLTEQEKALLDSRLAAYLKNPEEGSSWKEVESRIRARLTR